MSRYAVSARPSSSLEPLVRHRLSLAALLKLQWEARRFTRYDLVVRTLAASALAEGVDADISLEWYQQMQQRRAGKDTLPSFRDLVSSVTTRGLDPDYPVGVSPRGELLDGAHRVAVALALGIEEMAVDVRRSRRPRPYGREWFQAQSFSADMLRACDIEADRLMATTGVDGFLFSRADPEETGRWLVPHLPSDTEVVSHSVVSLDQAMADELERAATKLPRHEKSEETEDLRVLGAGQWGVWRLRAHRPRFARRSKTATAVARTHDALAETLRASLGENTFLLTRTHSQQRMVASVLRAAGWNHREGTAWV